MSGEWRGAMRRVEWIDVAKGLAIILIVMVHARDYALSLIPPNPAYPIRWTSIDPLFSYIRLPLFFLVSGMLASGAFSRREGAGGYNMRRTRSLLFAYLFWSVPLLFLVSDWPRDTWRVPDLALYVDLLRGQSVLWYLWAVGMAFGWACAVKRLHVIAAIALSALLGLWLQVYGDALGGAFAQLGRCLPYYILGIRFPVALLWLARWRSPVGFVTLLTLYVLTLAFEPHLAQLNALREVMGISMAVVGIGWATERWPAIARNLGWLGRRTLPVYIFHFPLMALIGSAAVRHGQSLAEGMPLLLLSSFLPILTVMVIALSLALSVLLRNMGLGWTMVMPAMHRSPMPEGRPVPA